MYQVETATIATPATVATATVATTTVAFQPCECSHFRGLFYYAFPWNWGTPCRYCRRQERRYRRMNRRQPNVIVVNAPVAVPNYVVAVR